MVLKFRIILDPVDFPNLGFEKMLGTEVLLVGYCRLAKFEIFFYSFGHFQTINWTYQDVNARFTRYFNNTY